MEEGGALLSTLSSADNRSLDAILILHHLTFSHTDLGGML